MKIDGACHCGYIRVEGEADPEKTTAAGAPLPEEKFPTRRRVYALLVNNPSS